ncbi:NPCBM/NEW2 domain-containing protein [Actinomadura pelletieri]|nr:NPCBM/NEW2 domain-containing protein [Actinomadura pelletieri]
MMLLTMLGVLVGLANWLFPRDRGSVGRPGEAATTSAPTQAATQLPATQPPVTTPPPTSPPVLPVTGWLADMEPVSDSSDVDPGPVTMGGKDFLRSLHVTCTSWCNDGNRPAEVYYLGGKYRTFEVTVGVNDRAEEEQVGVFQITRDGHNEPDIRVSSGKPKKVTINVTGVLRLRLEAFRPGTTDDPAMAGARAAGGESNLMPDLAWGDPSVSE